MGRLLAPASLAVAIAALVFCAVAFAAAGPAQSAAAAGFTIQASQQGPSSQSVQASTPSFQSTNSPAVHSVAHAALQHPRAAAAIVHAIQAHK